MGRSDAVINARGLQGFFRAAAQRRVDIIGVFDSNGRRNLITGHSQGMTRAWATALGCWGAGIAPFTGAFSSGAAGWQTFCGDYAAGGWVGAAGLASGGSFTAAPDAFEAKLLPASPAYLPYGPEYVTNWPGTENGPCQYSIRSQHPLCLLGNLKYSARVYIPAAGAATTVNPNVMTQLDGGAAFTIVHPAVNATAALPTGAGFHTFTWDISGMAAPADGTGLRIRLQRWGAATITGTLGILYQSLENPAQTSGSRFSTFIYAGGQSSQVVAELLCNTCPDESIAEYFRFAASRQVDANGNELPPILLVQVIEGGNDAADSSGAMSYTRGAGFMGAVESLSVFTNTQAGYVMNMTAIMRRLRDIWVTNCGYNERNLYFLLGCYHPQAVSPQAAFVGSAVPAAIEELCAAAEFSGNVCGLDGYQLKSAEQFRDLYAVAVQDTAGGSPFYDVASESYYNNPADPDKDEAHLTEHAYIAWGELVVGALMESQFSLGSFGSTSNGPYSGGRRSLR